MLSSVAYCLAFILGGFEPKHAFACPATLFGFDVPALPQVARRHLRLFVSQGKLWRPLPLQVDPRGSDGQLRFFPDRGYLDRPLERTDLLTFRPADFGEKVDLGKQKLPCAGKEVYVLSDVKKLRFGYLTSCQDDSEPSPTDFAVHFDLARSELSSANYRYQFDPNNYMQFRSIAFRRPMGWDEVASQSRLFIRADVKNFFTMTFDHDEIVSRLEDKRLGPLGNMARLSFYLRVLFFKIKISLSTDVGFYEDSSHIPMVVNLPVDATKYLNPRSGILYTWRIESGLNADTGLLRMPKLNPALVEKGFHELAKQGLPYCLGEECAYSFVINDQDRRLKMSLLIKRELVERGFFPLFVKNTAVDQDVMGWKVDDEAGSTRMGMYFEVSGLKEGAHPWDFWLGLGDSGQESKDCPVPVKVSQENL